jgi:hypothetical protein
MKFVPSLEDQLKTYKQKLGNKADQNKIKSIENSIRNGKIRGYLEKRFYRNSAKGINSHPTFSQYYLRVGGQLKFLGL